MKALSLLFIVLSVNCIAQNSKRKYTQNQTVTYEECIEFYKILEKNNPNTKLITYGLTDVGIPLHLFMITNDKDFDIESIKKKGKSVLLINNGIHAGEPCGVDACLQLSEDLLINKELNTLLKNVVVCIIPFYNIDGA